MRHFQKLANVNIFDRYHDYLRFELNRSQLTVDAYLRDLRQFARYAGIVGDEELAEKLSKITTADIRRWLGCLAAQGNSSVTIRRKTQSLRTFYRYLLRIHLIKVNPAADIVLAKAGKPLPAFVREQDMERILDAPADKVSEPLRQMRDRLMVSLLYTTGMRRAELLGLKRTDVDLGNSQLKVTGKRGKQRVIPLAEQTVGELREYLQRRDTEEPPLPARPDEQPFFTHKGKPLTKNRLTEAASRQKESARIASYVCHGHAQSWRRSDQCEGAFGTFIYRNHSDIHSSQFQRAERELLPRPSERKKALSRQT